MAAPELIFGTANVGSAWTDSEDINALARRLQDGGIRHLDTAARYPPNAPGTSQRLLGVHGFGAQGFAIDTKVLASPGDGSGEMAPEAIEKSVTESLEALKIEKINVLYSHRPDPSTPLATQAAALDSQFKQGRFGAFGVSNWRQDSIAAYLAHVDRAGGVRPTVAQYQYNLLARSAEAAFVPFLRQHGIRLVAFSPLAGGFLTGKLSRARDAADASDDALKGSRFEAGNALGAGYRHWYDRAGMHAAVERLTALCAGYAVPLPEAALRWLAYHSALRETDAILVGASSVAQVDDTLAAVAAGPLPEGLVADMDAVWELCQEDAKVQVTF